MNYHPAVKALCERLGMTRRTEEGFLYLALISDRWSRKLVGYHAGDTLEAAGLPAGGKPVHHADRGGQYCCRVYVMVGWKKGCPDGFRIDWYCNGFFLCFRSGEFYLPGKVAVYAHPKFIGIIKTYPSFPKGKKQLTEQVHV